MTVSTVTTSRTGKTLRDPQPRSVEEVLRVWEHGARIGDGTARGALLADPMGLGKTATAVVAAHRAGFKRALVLCPKSAIADWTRELADWHPDPGLLRILTAESDRPLPDFNAGWAITNYEQLERHAVDLRRRQWGLLILDEAHATKEPERKRSIMVHGGMWRGKAYSSIPARKALVISGTPMRNRIEELWTSLHFLDPATWLDRATFIDEYYEPLTSSDQPRIVTEDGRVVQNVDPRNLDQLHRLLKRTVLVRTPKDTIAGLPSRRFEKKEVILEDVVERDWFDQQALKVQRVTRMLREAQRQQDRDRIREIEERQREMRSAIYQHATRAKRHAVLDYLLKLPPEHKAVVIGFHRDLLLDQLARALHQRGRRFVFHHGGNSKHVARTVRAFQTDPQVQFFLGQLNVSSLSLTLTAASHVVFAEIPQTRADFDQAMDRVHRLGQTATECTATVFSVTWPSAGDEDLLDALLHWKDRASQVLDGKDTNLAWDWHLPVEHRPDERMSYASGPGASSDGHRSMERGTHFRPPTPN